MKKILLVVLIVTFWRPLSGQNCNPDLLSDECFDKMIINDVTYAIFGESNPVNGIKVDVSKPEATISGVFDLKKTPWILIGFDFKGGITDKNFSIYKGTQSFNTALEFRPNFHFIPSWNGAWFKCEDVPIVKAKNKLVENKTLAIKDTFLVVATIYNKHLASFPELQDTDIEVNQFLDRINPRQKKLLIQIISRLTQKKMDDIDSTANIYSILNRINVAAKLSDGNIDINTYSDNIINTYRKYKKLNQGISELHIISQIQNAKDVWTKKRLIWFTLSPFGRTDNINFYHTEFKGLDSLYFKKDYPFSYGLGGSTNFLWSYPDKVAHFFKFGINLSYSNNTSTLTSFNYETRTNFFSYPNNITEKTKSGSAYNYSDFKRDFLSQFVFEYYLLPFKNFIPGFYYSGSMNVSNLYNLPKIVGRSSDIFLASMEGGLVFNINSREKETQLLSLLVYARFEDLTDSRRKFVSTNIEEPEEDFYKRNLSIGIKVGIPIYMPQKGK